VAAAAVAAAESLHPAPTPYGDTHPGSHTDPNPDSDSVGQLQHGRVPALERSGQLGRNYRLAGRRDCDDRTWASLGLSRLEEKQSLLGGRRWVVFGGAGSTSLFLDLEARRDLGSGWSAAMMGRRGWTDFAGGRFQSGAYAFDLAKIGLLDGNDRLGLRLSQPLRIESGGIAMMLPIAYDYATENETSALSRLSFTPSGREIDAELGYSTLWGKGWLGANLFVRHQPGHIASADADLGAAIRYNLDF